MALNILIYVLEKENEEEEEDVKHRKEYSFEVDIGERRGREGRRRGRREGGGREKGGDDRRTP